MQRVIDNIENYFQQRREGNDTGDKPDLVCPTCWGVSEWDGQFYEVVKDKHLTDSKIYESFISKVVDEHVTKTHQHGDKYVCITCDKEIN